MSDKEIKQWITINGVHIPIFEGEKKSDAIQRHIAEVTKQNEKTKEKQIAKNKKEAKERNEDTSYRLQHRPGNPIENPDEVATIDKIANGNYFPKDILDNARDYFPDYDNFKGTAQTIAILKAAQKNPEMEVTIYRGAPSGGALHQGDWVTLNKAYAEDYAKGGNYSDNDNSKVYSYKVKAKELSFDGDSIYEFGYWGKSRKK